MLQLVKLTNIPKKMGASFMERKSSRYGPTKR
jgi:hypothetical protein